MSGLEIGLVSVASIIVLIYCGMHVAVALNVVSFFGLWAFKGKIHLSVTLLSHAAAESISGYIFGVIPLFILMRLLVSVSDIGRDTFQAANHFLKKLSGGLGVATVAANAAFAAVTGISIASAAVFTKVAVPEMIRLGYQPKFAVGVVAGSSVLGMLIPPSLLLIVYALIAEQSVGHMFIAGIVPGVFLALAFCLAIIGMARFLPSKVSTSVLKSMDDDGETLTSTQAVILLLPLVLLITVVLGGIYSGLFTPTESGAVGVVGALVLALMRRKLDFGKFWQVLLETGHITVSISLLIISASVYSRMLSLTGLPGQLADWVQHAGFGFFTLITIYVLIILVMGTLIDAISTMLIIVPIFLPLVSGFVDVNLVWFGVITVIAAEIGLLTPPMGLSAFVIKDTLDDRTIGLGDIFRGSFPFVLVMIGVLILIIAFPQISIGVL